MRGERQGRVTVLEGMGSFCRGPHALLRRMGARKRRDERDGGREEEEMCVRYRHQSDLVHGRLLHHVLDPVTMRTCRKQRTVDMYVSVRHD